MTVAQSRRTERVRGAGEVEWVPFDYAGGQPALDDVAAVIVVRSHKVLPRVRLFYPRARLFLWLHCFPGRHRRDIARIARFESTTIVAVSQYHREWLRDWFHEYDSENARGARIETIYDPIPDQLAPDGTVPERDRLLFLSSPHKGLDQVLEAFRAARERLPDLRLRVANPGYMKARRRAQHEAEGAEFIGELPHDEAIRELRGAFCLFYPQSVFAETFGLVFAEANAVGTPVIAHPIGAAEEVISGSREQLVDATRPQHVIETLLRWRRQGRPVVNGRDEFRLEAVTRAWENLLFAEERTSFESARREVSGEAVVAVGLAERQARRIARAALGSPVPETFDWYARTRPRRRARLDPAERYGFRGESPSG